jgi:hypothetical protein
MDPRLRTDLLWGAIGGLSFLVLLQGYHLAGGTFVGVGPTVAVTAVVFLVTAVVARAVRPRVAGRDGRG